MEFSSVWDSGRSVDFKAFGLAQSQPRAALRVFEDAEDDDEAESQPGDLRGVYKRHLTPRDRGPGQGDGS
jgi:hypothetical protein